MITVGILTVASGELVGFSINDHAGYGDAGNDIVCAAVSSAAYLIANTITDVMHLHATIRVDEENADMLLKIEEKDAIRCRDLLTGFKLHIVGLEEQYPENIQVSYLEVRSNA